MLTPESEHQAPTKVKGEFVDTAIFRIDKQKFICDFFKVLDPEEVPHYSIAITVEEHPTIEVTYRNTFGIWRPTSNYPCLSPDLSFKLSSQITKFESIQQNILE